MSVNKAGEALKSVGKAIAETPKRVKEDLSEIKIPLNEGIKEGKKVYDETGSLISATSAGAEKAFDTGVNNAKQIGKAVTEGSVFSVLKAAEENKKAQK